MHATELSSASPSHSDRSRQRMVAVVETLATMKHRGGTVSEVAHDARNMVTALALYCDLLSEPGVLSGEFTHYANELRLVAAASRRLVEKLMLIDVAGSLELDLAMPKGFLPRNPFLAGPTSPPASLEADPAANSAEDLIDNLQKEVLANRNLLDALAGLGIALSVRTEGGARPVRLSREDLTRVLVNLVRNAAEAMHGTGSIELTLRDVPNAHGEVTAVALMVDDSGPGIPEEMLETIFEAGCTSTAATGANPQHDRSWPATHHGLGLSIVHSVIEAAGGRIHAEKRPAGGARFHLELPIVNH